MRRPAGRADFFPGCYESGLGRTGLGVLLLPIAHMKTVLRFLAAGMLLAFVTPVFASVDAGSTPSPALQFQPVPVPTIVSHRTALSAAELAKYQQLEQATQEQAEKQAAGEGMDKSTMIIIAVVAVVVVVAVAAGGGGGGSGY